MDPSIFINILVAILLVIATFLLLRKLKRKVNVVLLTGLSNSGKTALFTKIIFNKPKKSVTSLKENEATIKELNLKLLDLPGAERLRSRYWEQYRTEANHVVFILDSTTLDKQLRDLSEYLYVLLSDGILYRNKIRFTIACNKQDLDGAVKSDEVRSTLEKELTAIMNTKTGQLGKASEEEEDDYLAKLETKEISLAKLSVNLIETSVQNPNQLVKLMF